MADLKFTSNGNIDVWAVPTSGIADINNPTAAEINAGVWLTEAIAWDGTTFPTSTDSDDVEDRSLNDAGNATTRGFAQFEATLNFFRPKDLTDTTTDYGKAYNFFKTTRVPVVLVTRVSQRTATGVYTPAATGDRVSLYSMLSTTFIDDTEGDDSYKYEVGFLPQGNLAVNTYVGQNTLTTTPATTLAATVGTPVTSRATLAGKRATQAVTWTVSDPTKARVTPNGVLIPLAAGSVTVTADHAAATAPATITVTVT